MGELFGHLLAALTPANLTLALAGVVAGTIIGSIPGLTATMAVAVLVPLTFAMDPASALIMLGAIYTGAIYGGAYAATIACLASVVGGLVGALFLLPLAPPLSRVALAFGPVEYFWLAIFGLSLIAALSEGSLLKGLAGGALGLIISCIGVAEIS